MWLPPGSELVTKTTLELLSAPVPKLVAPSKKATVPVGTPAPGGMADTRAVKVTGVPKETGEAGWKLKVVVVLAW